jgi:uncharacterized membrane protein YeiH
VATKRRGDVLLALIDVAATAVFALEGALEAIAAQLDLFGVLAVGVVTATAGGIIRDLLIGDVPPASIRHARYLVAAVTAGAIAVLFQQLVNETPVWLLTGLDAAGLSLFAVAGASKALDFGSSGVMAAVIGTITGVGGGTVRDLLVGEVPAILRIDVYAVAALTGAAVLVILTTAGSPRWAAMATGAAACFALRVTAATFDWNLPVPGR